MEAELQRFVYDRPEILAAMGSPTITCRSTRCEVTFINYAVDERSLEAARRLRGDYSTSDLPNAFRAGAGYAASPGTPGNFWIGEHLEDGVATIFWSLPRARDWRLADQISSLRGKRNSVALRPARMDGRAGKP